MYYVNNYKYNKILQVILLFGQADQGWLSGQRVRVKKLAKFSKPGQPPKKAKQSARSREVSMKSEMQPEESSQPVQSKPQKDTQQPEEIKIQSSTLDMQYSKLLLFSKYYKYIIIIKQSQYLVPIRIPNFISIISSLNEIFRYKNALSSQNCNLSFAKSQLIIRQFYFFQF
ncbi:Hypothetical_protein [Hexamita inflata]|uniref:Hypothetical_protein n=1 Tax=Hexamita inflata TaxID=28002 RepID=A0ABP1KFD8_9EUKA